MTRVVVFVDYQNAYMRARDLFGASPADPYTFGQIHPRRLGLLLTARRRAGGHPCALLQVRVYRGEPDVRRNPVGHAACRRQVGIWTAHTAVVPCMRPLRYLVTARSRSGKAIAWEAREKGIDVLLAIDMVVGAIHDRYDVAVLVSEDTDLLPAVEAVFERGKTVEVASWRPDKRWTPRLTLPDRNLWCHWLRDDDFERVRDDTDYTKAAGVRRGP